MKLLKTEQLAEVIKLVIYSGYLKNSRPLSLLITASVGSGKTELVKQFNIHESLVYITDVTARGLQKDLMDLIDKGIVKHIVIPDLIIPLSKQKSTRNTFISFLNALLEEGIANISTAYFSKSYKDLRCGLITCIAREDFMFGKRDWKSIGFLSRLIPLSYEYSKITAIDILRKIVMTKNREIDKIKLNLPEKIVEVKEDFKLNEKLIPYATAVSQKAKETYAFRRTKQFIVLMKANALMNHRNKVEQEDFDKVKGLMEYMNLSFKEL